jgi:uncharacterized membrane protein YtjA (UPF0391 family)
VLGFTNIAAGARTLSKILFGLFLILFLVVLIFGVILHVLIF